MANVLNKFRIMLLNAENLFLLSDQVLHPDHLKLDEIQWQKLSTSVYENKPLQKCKAIAKIVEELQPDLILLCEVGGLESLKNYNTLFLKDQFSPALMEGNSDRNIDVGFLIKKNQNFYFDLISNKNRHINYLYPHERQSVQTGFDDKVKAALPSHKFSRDAVELHLFTRDREKPFFICLLTHLKSRLDPENKDPNGFERRQAELKTLLEIYKELETKHPLAGVLVAGDLNGNASPHKTDPEFHMLYSDTKLRDICDIAGHPPEETATFYQVGRNSKTEGKQLDYCFLSPRLQDLLDSKSVQIYRYKDHLGFKMDPPSTIDAKLQFPSDHYPLVFDLLSLPIDS